MADNPTCPACGHYNAILGRECRDCGVNAVTWTIAQLPERFGLRGFPGDVFRCGTRESYINDSGVVTLYLQRWQGDSGGVFCVTFSRKRRHVSRGGEQTAVTVVRDIVRSGRRVWAWVGPDVPTYCRMLNPEQWAEAFAFWEKQLLTYPSSIGPRKWMDALSACNFAPVEHSAEEQKLLDKLAEEKAFRAQSRKSEREWQKEQLKQRLIAQSETGSAMSGNAVYEYVASMVADIRVSVLIVLGDEGPMTASELRSFFNGSGYHTPMVLLHRALDALLAEGAVVALDHEDDRARQGGAPTVYTYR